MSTSTLKELDDSYLKGSQDRVEWFVHDPSSGIDSKTVDAKIAEVKAKGGPMWPKSFGGIKGLITAMTAIRDVPPVTAGMSERVYQMVLADMSAQGFDTAPFERRKGGSTPSTTVVAYTRADVLGGELAVKDGKIRPVVDKGLFKTQVNRLLGSVNRLDILKSIAKSASEQDFWGLILDMLTEEESFQLIGLLAARLLLPQDQRNALDIQLAGVTVLQNRQGKLSVGVVRMGGFLGLACVKGEPEMAQATKFIRNPLLGEDVENRPPVKKPSESVDQFATRKAGHETQFANYKAIMTELKKFKEPFDKLDVAVKTKIKTEVLKFCVAG